MRAFRAFDEVEKRQQNLNSSHSQLHKEWSFVTFHPMAKKKVAPDSGPTVQVTFRIPEDWLERAENIAGWISSDGLVLNRTDGFRAAMAEGFTHYETRFNKKRK